MSLLTRPALYYPHLQFTDPNWLKEALLSFRQVRRMAPAGYRSTAGDAAEPVRDVEIPSLGPMIMLESLDDVGPECAQGQLYHWLQTLPPHALQRFDRAHTIAAYGNADGFQMHPDKFTDGMLGFLQQHGLAWHASNATIAESRVFLSPGIALHPQLGEAIMSVMAIAIADTSSSISSRRSPEYTRRF